MALYVRRSGGLLPDDAIIANHVTIPQTSVPSTTSSATTLAPPAALYPHAPSSPVSIISYLGPTNLLHSLCVCVCVCNE